MNIKSKVSALLTTLITLTSIVEVVGQTLPRMIVCVNVKGLRTDILSQYRSSFEENGFNTLYRDGIIIPQLVFDFDLHDPVCAIASIYTGTYPQTHKIVTKLTYNEDVQRAGSVFYDKRFDGIFTQQHLSPLALKSETLSDVLQMESLGKALTISVAAEPEDALASAGSESDAAIWIDPKSGNWCTSGFYGSLPQSIAQLNTSQLARKNIQGALWSSHSLKDASRLLPYNGGAMNFEYSFSSPKGIENFISSPLANNRVIELAQHIIGEEAKNSSLLPTLLTLTLNVRGSVDGHLFSDYSIETYDSYKRTNDDIASLIQSLDRTVGRNRYVLMLCSAPGSIPIPERRQSTTARRVTTTFVPDRCMALTNMYLTAMYGRNTWVKEIRDGILFLNREAIEKAGLTVANIREKVASFIAEMEGVEAAIPALSNPNNLSRRHRRMLLGQAIDPKADVLIFLHSATLPSGGRNYNHQRVSGAIISGPAFFLIPKTSPLKLERPIDALSLAPTMAYILRIRPPTDALAPPITEIQNITDHTE